MTALECLELADRIIAQCADFSLAENRTVIAQALLNAYGLGYEQGLERGHETARNVIAAAFADFEQKPNGETK